jgi:5-epi-alpha-selinene synthase
MVNNKVAPKIPSIFCPIGSKIAPEVNEVQEFTNQWACKFHFLKDEMEVKKFAKGKFASLAARAYVGADVERLKLLSCWLSFTFFLDDQCEKLAEPEQLQTFFTRFMSSLRCPSTNQGNGPLFEALADLWKETLPLCPSSEFASRLIKDLGDYFEGYAWEAANTQSRRIPPMSEYLHFRQFTVCIYFLLHMYSLAHHINLPEDIPELSELTKMANNLIAWFNDIISLSKELQENDVHNLVLVIQNEFQCSLQVAMDRAVEMHNLEMKKFLELESLVRAKYCSDDQTGIEISKYLNGLRTCIRGNVDWSCESGRYFSSGAKPEDLFCA